MSLPNSLPYPAMRNSTNTRRGDNVPTANAWLIGNPKKDEPDEQSKRERQFRCRRTGTK